MTKNSCFSLNALLLLMPLFTNAMENHESSNPLLNALDKEEYELATTLVESGASVNVCDSNDETPLIKVVKNFKQSPKVPQLIKLLIEKGANINAKSKFDWHPLSNAAFWVNYEACSILIDSGADVNLTMSEKGKPGYNMTIKQFITGWPVNPDLQAFCTKRLLEREKKDCLAEH